MPEEYTPRRIVLVRHGSTNWSESGRHTGWTDIPLNADGIRQAGTLGPRLAEWSFDAVLSSPLQRARATCQLAGNGEGAEIDPDLREWNYGDYEGMTTAEIRAGNPNWILWNDGVRGGETLDQVAERADRVVARLRSLSGDIAVFAHGHLLRVLAARWIQRPPSLAQFFNLSTATISTLSWEHEWPTITLWNDGAHLRTLS